MAKRRIMRQHTQHNQRLWEPFKNHLISATAGPDTPIFMEVWSYFCNGVTPVNGMLTRTDIGKTLI